MWHGHEWRKIMSKAKIKQTPPQRTSKHFTEPTLAQEGGWWHCNKAKVIKQSVYNFTDFKVLFD
jgi:hypothetical protein